MNRKFRALMSIVISSLLLLPGCSEKPAQVSLSQTSTEVLKKIKAPVEIRFYHGVEENTPASKLEAHARELLRAYAAVSGGNITISEVAVTNDATATQAIADGIRPFNIEKGDAAYLGVVMQSGEHKEALPVLSPDFASALEADVTRALDRIRSAQDSEQPAPEPEPVSPEVVERVKAAVPNYKDVPLEQGTQVLRENMLSDLQKAGSEWEAKIAEIRSRSGGSAANEAALREEITKAEMEHNEKLKRIVQNSTAEIQALQGLKATQ